MGSTFPISKPGKLLPALGLSTHAQYTDSTTALPVAGVGVAADRITGQQSNTTTGVFMFDVHEGTGLELHFASREDSVTGETSEARVFREIAIAVDSNSNPVQWTYRHLCDIALTASLAQLGVSGGVIDDALYWCVPTVSADAGLSPSGTRVMQGATAGAAGSVIIDPVCAGRIMVVCRKLTSAGVTVYGSKWTGM